MLILEGLGLKSVYYNRTLRKYLLLVILALIIVSSCIFSWCNVMRVNLVKGCNLVCVFFDVVLLAVLSIICVRIFVFIIKKLNSFFMEEDDENKQIYNEIKFENRRYHEVKYIDQNESIPLKFYARRIGKNKVCLLAENENGRVFYKEYVSYDYFLEHFHYP